MKNEVDDNTKQIQLQEEALRSNIGDKGKSYKGKGKQAVAAAKEATDTDTSDEKSGAIAMETAESKDDPSPVEKIAEGASTGCATDADADSKTIEVKTEIKSEAMIRTNGVFGGCTSNDRREVTPTRR